MDKALLKKQKAGRNKFAIDCVIEELKVLQRLEHPNVLWLHEIIDDPKKDKLYLVTEWYKKGSLSKYIGKDMQPYFIDMLKALYYCHNVAKVIHRDIKPDNIMLNHNDEAVLIDFGVSSQDSEMIESNMGTYMLFSPEMFGKDKVLGEKSDIWALGMTFYYLLVGYYPWKDAKNPL